MPLGNPQNVVCSELRPCSFVVSQCQSSLSCDRATTGIVPIQAKAFPLTFNRKNCTGNAFMTYKMRIGACFDAPHADSILSEGCSSECKKPIPAALDAKWQTSANTLYGVGVCHKRWLFQEEVPICVTRHPDVVKLQRCGSLLTKTGPEMVKASGHTQATVCIDQSQTARPIYGVTCTGITCSVFVAQYTPTWLSAMSTYITTKQPNSTVIHRPAP